ncbi:Glucosamine-phosphate N-acetyltransferase [Paragonimus heterotremus]|uniref:Glucosamine 6-phosphate N-acetyltransferase n=1 Tax=Paragonimus heterotremus TaxID=100268 RepID=A0A8J4WRN2_9TREM|nr:Glucosamine-phosphate N-acetyltransferase [Paragonimus heterotremus]
MDNLFSPKLLEVVGIDRLLHANVKDKMSEAIRDNIRVRPLCSSDHESYLQLLCELTDVGSVDNQEYIATFNQMMRCPDTYYILVLENISSNQIIAAATLVIERKFIHSCAKRGHIEDLVVCSEYRGNNFGKFLVEALVAIGKHQGCYKISLDCKDDKVRFYERIGFVRLNNVMYLRLDTQP